MGDISILIIGIIDTLFGFFVVAPCILNAVSLFGVQKQFAKAMVDEGVIKAEDVQRIHPKKQIAGIIVSALVLAVLIYTCAKSAPWGYACWWPFRSPAPAPGQALWWPPSWTCG